MPGKTVEYLERLGELVAAELALNRALRGTELAEDPSVRDGVDGAGRKLSGSG